VIAGTNDGAATIVGAGLRRPGEAVDVGGASGGLAVLADRPVDLPGIYCAPSLLPDRWVLGGAMMAIGSSLEWLARSVLAERWTITELIEEAAGIAPGAGGLVFLPYLAGERSPIWDDRARGVFCGLRLEHGRAHLVRAVLEGGAFALRHVAAPIADAGVRITELRVAGRPASSRVWTQIKRDVLAVPATVPRVLDASVLGAATIAAVGARLLPDLDAAIAAMRGDRERFEPRPEHGPTYDALFSVYRNLYPALRDSFEALSRI
jgi:xylulokinase